MPESVTNQGEDKELGDALDSEFLVSVADREEPPANPGNAHAEGAGRSGGEGGNVVGDGPLVEMEKALVAGGDEGLDVSIGREYAGRYAFGLRRIAGEGIVALAAGDVGGQAFALGLVEEVAMDVVPVVFGSGKRYFGAIDGAPRLLEDPHTVVQGDRVLHLRYRVRRAE